MIGTYEDGIRTQIIQQIAEESRASLHQANLAFREARMDPHPGQRIGPPDTGEEPPPRYANSLVASALPPAYPGIEERKSVLKWVLEKVTHLGKSTNLYDIQEVAAKVIELEKRVGPLLQEKEDLERRRTSLQILQIQEQEEGTPNPDHRRQIKKIDHRLVEIEVGFKKFGEREKWQKYLEILKKLVDERDAIQPESTQF